MNLANLTKEEKAAMKEHMRQCEAKYWLNAYQRMMKRDGKFRARDWWDKVISDIARIRGDEGANDLRRRMNDLRGN